MRELNRLKVTREMGIADPTQVDWSRPQDTGWIGCG